ncbi:MAG: putative penicillin-binding protein PbpX [Firmicutes bacterium ADurb.Bin182]|nr:MAG: putative penicillin-binding protein PbpX [Firmicutes bacterium ADurb.Bin182]
MKTKNSISRFSVAVLAVILSLSVFQTAGAADRVVSVEKAELEGFMDNIITENMEKYHLPGAVYSIVQDGSVISEKGYGYSDVDNKIPVDPESTVFRVGSISKLFTATAVMQLKERGIIDFEKDINEYLKEFKIQNRYSKPVTMYNLITHTAGFDDRWTGVETAEYQNAPSLGEYLSKNMPEVIREPGTVTQYSNHGMALAGYIVEEISGMPFEQYIIENIIKPLRMKHTYPKMTQAAVNSLAREYSFKDGSFRPMRLYEVNAYPAGSVCSSASDMAVFMAAHLNDGTFNDASILNKETAREMHSRQFANSPELPGMCFGFYEKTYHNNRFIVHAGDTNGTHSFLLLDPVNQLGLFVSTNGAEGQPFITELTEQFIRRCYPGDGGAGKEGFGPAQIAGTEGRYRSVRYARNTLDKLVLLLTPETRVRAEGESLTVQSPSGNEERYIQTGPFVFTNTESGERISFGKDSRGNIAYMFIELPVIALEKVRWYESNILHMLLLGASLVLSLIWCVYSIISSARAKKKKSEPRGRFAKILLTCVCILNIGTLAGVLLSVLSMDSVLDIGFMLPSAMKILLAGQVAAAALTAVLAAETFIVWIRAYWKATGRMFFTLTAVLNICFTLIMYYYNLIGIKY